VRELDGGLPEGFRAAGVACGLKPSGGLDLGLLVSDAPDTVSAARFSRSGVLAAPVLLTQERCRLDASARWSPTRATRTPRPGRARHR
jgi:glutamate N-acetyltransferase/amino-acid N-acetyltransferase